jgi:opacity protein-like surface antigen
MTVSRSRSTFVVQTAAAPAFVFTLLAGCLVSHEALSQDSETTSERGWEASIGLLYQSAENIGFTGGAFLATEDDIGVVGAIGYRFNPKLDLVFGFESATIGYELTRQSATTPGTTQQIATDYEAFTPFVKFNYNFIDRSLMPFVSAGIGWSFIDTNIPTGNTSFECWWDPWWGYLCGEFAQTKTTKAFAYQLGAGARWTFNDTYGMRLEYQKQWLNLSRAVGTPSFDQLKLTLVVKYW